MHLRHLDVQPAALRTAGTAEPFTLVERDGRLLPEAGDLYHTGLGKCSPASQLPSFQNQLFSQNLEIGFWKLHICAPSLKPQEVFLSQQSLVSVALGTLGFPAPAAFPRSLGLSQHGSQPGT